MTQLSGIIMNISGDPTLSIGDINEAANLVHSVVDYSANFIFGANILPELKDQIVITIIATGFADNPNRIHLSVGKNSAYESLVAPQVTPLVDENPTQVEEVAQVVEEVVVPTEESAKEEVKTEKKHEIPPFVKKLFGKK